MKKLLDTYANPVIIEIIKAKLEDSGIVIEIQKDAANILYPSLHLQNGISIYVDEKDYQLAKEIAEEVTNGIVDDMIGTDSEDQIAKMNKKKQDENYNTKLYIGLAIGGVLCLLFFIWFFMNTNSGNQDTPKHFYQQDSTETPQRKNKKVELPKNWP